MTRPLVSIVIAAYRSRADHLTAAIASALHQSWKEIEIIVSDDSPDDSLAQLVAAFRDSRLRYRHNRTALGVALNHWRSFCEARGEFVAVLNHDDWLAPGFVETLSCALQQQPNATLAFCDHWVIDRSGRRLDEASASNSAACGRSRLAPGMHLNVEQLLAGQTIPMAMGAVFRRSALPSALPAEAGPAYDLWLTYLLCRGGGAWYAAERLSAWRMHEASLSSEGGIDWLHGTASCWRQVARDDGFASIRPLARSKAALGYYSCAVRAWAGGRRVDCLGFVWRSVTSSLTLRGLVAFVLLLLPKCLAPARWVRGRVLA